MATLIDSKIAQGTNWLQCLGQLRFSDCFRHLPANCVGPLDQEFFKQAKGVLRKVRDVRTKTVGYFSTPVFATAYFEFPVQLDDALVVHNGVSMSDEQVYSGLHCAYSCFRGLARQK